MDTINASNYAAELNSRIARVFANHPELHDHRKKLPWLTGYLGNPFAGIWFLAEIPSLRTATRAPATMATPRTVESQFAISRGDQLFRESLVHCGFKAAPWDSPGGWRCYVTDVIKVAERAGEYNKRGRWLPLAETWADVLAWELEASQPRLVVVMGKRTQRLIEHLALVKQLRFPRTEAIPHYSYVAFRPRGKQAPMHPKRVREYRDAMERVARVFAEVRSQSKRPAQQRTRLRRR